MRAIAETRVKMRNEAMNILPTPCTMMVVGHFPCLERLFVCVYAMTQDIASASNFGNYSELMHGPSLWSGQCQVHYHHCTRCWQDILHLKFESFHCHCCIPHLHLGFCNYPHVHTSPCIPSLGPCISCQSLVFLP